MCTCPARVQRGRVFALLRRFDRLAWYDNGIAGSPGLCLGLASPTVPAVELDSLGRPPGGCRDAAPVLFSLIVARPLRWPLPLSM